MVHRAAWVIDDHKIFAAGLARLLPSLPGIENVETFVHPEDAAKARWTEPALIVMDYYIPKSRVTDWLPRFRIRLPKTELVVMTSSLSAADRASALEAGARAVFAKHQDPETVLRQLEDLLHDHEQPIGPKALVPALLHQDLTSRQLDVLVQLARGHSVKEIARHFDISPETVKTHLAQIYKTLGVPGREAASQWARENGLV